MIQHKHILINAIVEDTLDSPDDAKKFLTDLVNKLNMKVLMGPHATFVESPGNEGITAIVGIETSHIAFHVWSETKPKRLQLDVYTCGELDVDLVLRQVECRFQTVGMYYKVYDRATGFKLIEEGYLASPEAVRNGDFGYRHEINI